jgi:hypothetical protein
MEKPADLIFGLDERPPLGSVSRLSERRGHVHPGPVTLKKLERYGTDDSHDQSSVP